MNKYCGATDIWRATNSLPHGIAILKDVARRSANKRVAARKVDALKEIREFEDSIRKRMSCYETLFKSFNYESPLRQQLERTLAQGFPTVNRFVDTLFICEMTTGILMGVQDFGQISGKLNFYLATEGEQFEGMREPVICQKGETLVRDDQSILASIFQGPDKRTAITRQTSDVIFFAFSVAGIPDQDVLAALDKAVEILGPAAREAYIETIDETNQLSAD